MSSELQHLVPVCDAVARLLAPHVEVVLHDLASGTVGHIANAFSRRRPGDSSLIHEEPPIGPEDEIVGPYAKTNWDGRRLKSITAVVRDQDDRPIALICFNQDLEAFLALREQIDRLAALPERAPERAFLFEGDWREGVNHTVGQFLSQRQTSIAGLAAAELDQLVGDLDEAGVFAIRKAVPYVTQILGCSRATLYKRLATSRRRLGKATSGEAGPPKPPPGREEAA